MSGPTNPYKTGARIFLGLPFYKTVDGYTLAAHDGAVDSRGQHQYVKETCGDAFLARSFNTLWCMALNARQNRKVTHFAMIHSDVAPQGFWLDKMLEEMRNAGADLLSVVLPIKTGHGLSSTAIRQRETGDIRRLTMTEVHEKLPTTFDGPTAAERLNLEGTWDLMPSSGLWVCDFTEAWVEKVWFEVRDRILRRPDGEFYAETAPDDWLFSIKLVKLGVRAVSTTAVKADHWGPAAFPNDCPWGSLKKDNRVGSFEWLGADDL